MNTFDKALYVYIFHSLVIPLKVSLYWPSYPPCLSLSLSLFRMQAVSRLFDSCSPLLNACLKNRKNWLYLVEGMQEEKFDDKWNLHVETDINEEEETERGAEQMAKEKETWYFKAFLDTSELKMKLEPIANGHIFICEYTPKSTLSLLCSTQTI